MERFVLTDAQWARMEPHCLGKPTDAGRSGRDNRLFVGAVLWVVRTGSPWRDLPAFFGNWNTVFKRYRDWVKADVFIRLFEACSDDPDMEYAMVDATIVKVHRHGQGAKGGPQSQAIGRSKGGMTTKILALTDALGNLVRFALLPGHRFDTAGVAPLIDGLQFDAFIADKAFDSNDIVAELNERGAKIVISQHPRRTKPLPFDAEMYKWRHLIENFFCKLKEFKRIAMRADKTDQSFSANIYRKRSSDPTLRPVIARG
ncbi:IS5 family transposase [Defluviicoccus vanus]|uniref:IS5 family transposase n=1 Tax=Defluviicoccus vanus TaxID=111831 RepID=A0A7H1MYS0_9PROT|nr:IS5 family transposase [Defluviicoccus vanus]QNT68606.1 IS5 family transposase [Defluviicoccus vanus]